MQLDLPFSIPFYRWLLSEEYSLSLADLSPVAPEVQVTLKRLQNIVKERDEILASTTLDEETKGYKVCLNDFKFIEILGCGKFISFLTVSKIQKKKNS